MDAIASASIAPRRGRPRLDAAPRRRRIVECAARLFVEQGYSGTTLEAVARAAGVTKRTIYEMVGDKDALFRAVCHHCFDGIGSVRLDVRIRGDDLSASLVEMAQWLIEHTLSTQTVSIVRAVLVERMRSPELAREVIASSKSALYAQIADFFEELAARDLIRLADPMRTAGLFYDLAVGNIGFRHALGYDEPRPTASEVRERVEVFIRGHLRGKVPAFG